jgi:hypothetical protein
MPFMWSMGTIIGPVIGGTLARPAIYYPSIFASDGLFGRFPYLLPNLVCAALILVAMIQGYCFLEETHPDLQQHEEEEEEEDEEVEDDYIIPDERQRLWVRSGSIFSTTGPGFDLRRGSYGTLQPVKVLIAVDEILPPDRTQPPKAFTHRVVMLILALVIFSYHQMTFDHLLPIFLQDAPCHSDSCSQLLSGGLGLTTLAVGLIMSVNGIIALFIQAVIFPPVATHLGIYTLFLFTTLLHPIAYAIMPLLTLMPSGALYTGIYASLAVRNLASMLEYPVLLILLKQACLDTSVLGRINGAAMSASSGARTLAPPVAGLLYGVGSEVAWVGSVATALLGVVQLLWIGGEKAGGVVVESGLGRYKDGEGAVVHVEDA